MIEFIDPNSNKLVSSGPTMARKAYYIHGTTSDNDRWSNYPSTVQQLNRIAFGIGVDKNDTEGINDMGSEKFKEASCDFSFEWGNNGILKAGNNWFLNTVEDRRIASEKLIEHINGNIGKCEEIVLIGHSHGGNVAIQAADKIFSKIPTVKRVFVLTIGTPAFNRLFITSYINNKNLITFNEKISEKIPYIGKDYVVPVIKLGRKFWGPLGIFLYINCENPATWKNKDKITHIALWNKKDHVDDMAWVLDRNKYFPYHGMTNNSAYFTNSITDNVEFDFAPADIRDYYKREIKPFAEWLANLDYLRFCLVDLRLKGYDLPKMPTLLTYKEYIFRRKKMEASKLEEKKYVNERDALRVDIPKPKPIMMCASTRLREEANDLQELFKSTNGFYQFMTDIDEAKRDRSKVVDTQMVIDIYKQKHPEIQSIEEIKQEMYRETEFLEKAMAIYLLDNTSFGEHGFDLANPKLIEEAINDGRIKPFPKTTTNDPQI